MSSEVESTGGGTGSTLPSGRTDGAEAPAQRLRAALVESAASLRRFLFGMCGNWDQAEDLAQEAMLKAWSRREKFDGLASPRTWVFAIARNHWLDQLRRKRTRVRETSMETDTFQIATPGRTAPSEALAQGELGAALQKALAKLPPEQREALAMRESEGLTFDQIAQVLSVSPNTVKSRVRYALMKLSQELEEYKDLQI